MSVLRFSLEAREYKSYTQEVSHENRNINIIKRQSSIQNSELAPNTNSYQEKSQGNSNANSGIKYFKNVMKHTKSMTNLIRSSSPNKLEEYDNYLISPIKEYKFKDKESAFTPLKNDSLLLFTPSMKLEVESESPFGGLEYFSARKAQRQNQGQQIKGKCINFNNIDLSHEVTLSHYNHEEKEEEAIGDNQSVAAPFYSNDNVIKARCTCTKTSCQKKYCACFANGKYCDDCECENCENKGVNTINVNNKSGVSIICNCSKSNCTKKYCECFKKGRNCSSLCRCINCINHSSIDHGKNNNFDNKNINNIPMINIASGNNNNKVDYYIEGTGIEIKNKMIVIIHRKPNSIIELNNVNIKKEDNDNNGTDNDDDIKQYTPMKVLGKKRNPNKTQSTNVKTPKLVKNRKSNRKKKALLTDK